MLNPNDRILLTDHLRPDPGYILDHALISTFTLDLTTLLEIPVALTFQEWDQTDSKDPFVRIGILDSLQRHVSRLTVVSQAGYVNGPPQGHPLLPLLETAIHTVVMPPYRTFHPKATLLRYRPDPDADPDHELPETLYRLIVSSRNLSPSRAWDTITVLDGKVTGRPVEHATGLDVFVRGVVALAAGSSGGIEPARRKQLDLMATEASRIEFRLPEGIEELRILPLGFDFSMKPRPIRNTRQGYHRLLISPFLTPGLPADDSLLAAYAGPQSTLVSRQDQLDAIPHEALAEYGRVMVLSDLVESAADDPGEALDDDPLDDFRQGLHAKLLVENHGYKARMLIGSANLTERAWDSNIELTLELTGRKSVCGAHRIVGESDREGLLNLLEEYRPSELDEEEPEVPDLKRAEQSLRTASETLAAAGFTLAFEETDADTLDLTLAASESTDRLPTEVEVQARPVTLSPTRKETLPSGPAPTVTWRGVPVAMATSLFDLELTASFGREKAIRRFVIKAGLSSPLPETRDRQIVRRLIENTEHLVSYLALLLAGTEQGPGSSGLLGDLHRDGESLQEREHPVELPLLEKMIQALDRDPTAIDRIELLLKDLHEDEAGKQLLPPGFEAVWNPILAAREKLRNRSDD